MTGLGLVLQQPGAGASAAPALQAVSARLLALAREHQWPALAELLAAAEQRWRRAAGSAGASAVPGALPPPAPADPAPPGEGSEPPAAAGARPRPDLRLGLLLQWSQWWGRAGRSGPAPAAAAAAAAAGGSPPAAGAKAAGAGAEAAGAAGEAEPAAPQGKEHEAGPAQVQSYASAWDSDSLSSWEGEEDAEGPAGGATEAACRAAGGEPCPLALGERQPSSPSKQLAAGQPGGVLDAAARGGRGVAAEAGRGWRLPMELWLLLALCCAQVMALLASWATSRREVGGWHGMHGVGREQA